MTTIVAYVEPITQRTWIGADSRATQGEHFVMPAVVEKLIDIGPWWVGITGSLAAIGLISSNADAIRSAGDDPRHVVKVIQDLFRNGDWHRCNDHPGPPCFEQHLTLVRKGMIYSVSGTGALIEVTPLFWAEGSGREYALGAMHAVTNNYDVHAEGRSLVLRALSAAAKYDLGTGEPFFVEEVFE